MLLHSFATFRPHPVPLRRLPECTSGPLFRPQRSDRPRITRPLIAKRSLFPSTARRKTVCVESLPRVHCFLHSQRVQRREHSITITGTMLITIIGTMPIAIIGNRLKGSGTRALVRDLETRTMRARPMSGRLTSVQATGTRAWEAGRPPGVDGTCANRSAPIPVLSTTSRDRGRTMALTPAAPRSARSWSGAITSGRLSVTRTDSGSFKAATMVTRCEPGRGLWPAPLPSAMLMRLHHSR